MDSSLGGDADTVGAMTGTMAGARFGIETIPVHWREEVANSESLHIRAAALSELRLCCYDIKRQQELREETSIEKLIEMETNPMIYDDDDEKDDDDDEEEEDDNDDDDNDEEDDDEEVKNELC